MLVLASVTRRSYRRFGALTLAFVLACGVVTLAETTTTPYTSGELVGTKTVDVSSSGGSTTTTTTIDASGSLAGVRTVTHRVETATKDKNGAITKQSRKADTTMSKAGKQISNAKSTWSEESNSDGGTTQKWTENTVDNETGETRDVVGTRDGFGPGSATSGEITTTIHKPGEAARVRKQRIVDGVWQSVSAALPAPRPIDAQPGSGEAGEFVVAPDAAGPSSSIVATFEDPQQGGASAELIVQVDDSKGHSKFFRAVTDIEHQVLLPRFADAVRLTLFKSFTKDGKPDAAAVHCEITSNALVRGTDAVPKAPPNGLAIVRASTSYERGGSSQGLVSLQTRGVDPAKSRILMDRSADKIRTLASSDVNVKAQIANDAPLGAHTFSVRSGNSESNAVPADLIALRPDPVRPAKPGQVDTVIVHVDGLPPNHPATMSFEIGGAATLVEGGATATVPVKNGVAQVHIRAERPGQFNLRFKLLVDIPDQPTVEPSEEPTKRPVEIPTPLLHRPDEVPCEVRITDGWFEPSQGAWQDDNVFEDHPTKQLTRLDDDGPPTYQAELDMISFRDTRLFGAHHYERHGVKVMAGNRGIIHMAGTTTCSDPPVPVRMKFTLERGAPSPRVLHVSEVVTQIRLTGHRVPSVGWTADLRSDDGIPPYPKPPFRIAAFGGYLVRDELIKPDGSSTGLAMTVAGNVHGIATLKVGFGTLLITQRDAAADANLKGLSATLGRDAALYIQDYYPLPPNSFTSGTIDDAIDLVGSDATRKVFDPGPGPTFSPEDQARLDGYVKQDAVKLELIRQGAALARLGGYQRLVLSVHQADMDFFVQSAAGYAIDKKVVLVLDKEDILSVAHELAHTYTYVWSGQQMKAQCSYPGDYHNIFDRLAYGVRLDKGGKPDQPVLQERMYSFMGPDVPPNEQWIDQCTFWHLADVLRVTPDPRVLLVRGAALRRAGHTNGLMWPSYSLDGTIDLSVHAAAKGEDWSIVLRNAAGREIAAYPFAIPWNDENGRAQNVVGFSYQVPLPPDLSVIELRGPQGVLVRKPLQSAAPAVHITSPANGAMVAGKSVRVTWSIVSPEKNAVSSVLYSSDGGSTYNPRLFEKNVTTFDVRLNPRATKHRIKVIVSDGTQSAEAFVDLRSTKQ
jgi:hypothetical protein